MLCQSVTISSNRWQSTDQCLRQATDPDAGRGRHGHFEPVFAMRTGYQELDGLLAPLYRRKDELLKVLENDLYTFVTKRKSLEAS